MARCAGVLSIRAGGGWHEFDHAFGRHAATSGQSAAQDRSKNGAHCRYSRAICFKTTHLGRSASKTSKTAAPGPAPQRVLAPSSSLPSLHISSTFRVAAGSGGSPAGHAVASCVEPPFKPAVSPTTGGLANRSCNPSTGRRSPDKLRPSSDRSSSTSARPRP